MNFMTQDTFAPLKKIKNHLYYYFGIKIMY